MSNIEANANTARYARCIAASKRIHWDIDEDVIRGRTLDAAHDYLPEGLSLVDGLPFLTARERRFRWQYIVSGVQDGKFLGVLASMITQPQLERIGDALAPLM
jgi:hypothetical protein